MRKIFKKYRRIRRIAFFFPLQLLLVHLKKNHLLLLFWLALFGIVTRNLAPKYGIPLLFLNPEYLDKVNFMSYLIVGFSCGGFIMAFNISSYIMNAFRFPFLATLSNPFLKYCLNNSIIPGTFVLVYIFNIWSFQTQNHVDNLEILNLILAFIAGISLFMFVSITYFFSTGKDLFKMFGVKSNENDNSLADIDKKEQRDWHVETYIAGLTKVRLARKFDHYEKAMLIKVFKQNHYTAASFEIFAIISLLVLGFFREIHVFMIPAGASVFLLFTMFLMLTSALYSWLRGWSTTVFILLICGLNFLFTMEPFNKRNKAYGLNYDGSKAEFSYKNLKQLDTDQTERENDVQNTIEILNKWRLKNSKNSILNESKPKLVLINTSGGGLRSTLWTFHVLQSAEKELQGQLLNHTALITGSSGGMVGAGFLRELYLRQKQGLIKDFYHDSLITNISKDILNPLAFTVAANDLFFRFQSFRDGKYEYSKDRAYAFECKLNENTARILDKRLKDYQKPESEAIIPMIVLAPTIINDGRKLIISSQPVSYLSQNNFNGNLTNRPLIQAIEFTKFFSEQDAMNLKFTSALRMNATFPYIMPIVSLPSKPAMEVMDAGIRDNYGMETTMKFLYTFRNWITSNTSGVVIIQIRDRHKEIPIEDNPPQTVMGDLSKPLGSFYGNTFNVQDFNQTQLLEYASSWFDGKIDVIDFQLRNEVPDNISLSWHLTNWEKQKVLKSIELPENQAAISKLKDLFSSENQSYSPISIASQLR